MAFLEIRDAALAAGDLCDHCLGRQVSQAFPGFGNDLIGAALRKAKKDADIKKLLRTKLKPRLTDKCAICKGIFLKIDDMFEKLVAAMNEQQFSTFLLGSKVNSEIIDFEEQLWAKTGMQHCEPIKRELNRIFGKKAARLTGKKIDFDHPDVVFTLDFKNGKVFSLVNPLFVYGRYKKFERGLPQTKWSCFSCAGRGCKECGGTGRQFQETVEELIAQSFLKAAGAKAEKFHSAGREDRSARMLGTGRPFVLEIIRPRVRDLDLKKIAAKINKECKGKIEVSGLRVSNKEEMRFLKARTFEKTYDALIKCEGVSKADLKKLGSEFKNTEIAQRTPTRVLPRRADKVRKRKVISVKCKSVSKNEFRATIKTSAGTYIKELISGDGGRTKPSFSSVLSKPCECAELDVIAISD